MLLLCVVLHPLQQEAEELRSDTSLTSALDVELAIWQLYWRLTNWPLGVPSVAENGHQGSVLASGTLPIRCTIGSMLFMVSCNRDRIAERIPRLLRYPIR